MFVNSEQILAVLSQFNPWWSGRQGPDLPLWHRTSFPELARWAEQPPVLRAVLLSGARQVGKTTMLRQLVRRLLNSGVPAANILYATFDHPVLKLAGVDTVLECWRSREVKHCGPEYLLLDEAQFIPGWGTWVKHQVDFQPQRRILFSGSATPLLEDSPESGVGRWHTIRLTTLSFYEFLQLKGVSTKEIPALGSLHQLFGWAQRDFRVTFELAENLSGHFHDYLLRGGFPQTVRIEKTVGNLSPPSVLRGLVTLAPRSFADERATA